MPRRLPSTAGDVVAGGLSLLDSAVGHGVKCVVEPASAVAGEPGTGPDNLRSSRPRDPRTARQALSPATTGRARLPRHSAA